MEKRSGLALLGVTCRGRVRRWVSSVLLLLVAAMGAFLAMVLQNLTARQEQVLQSTIQNSVISCTVTDARGTGSDNLQMLSAFVEMLEGKRRGRGCCLDDYVKNVRAKAEIPLEIPAGARLRRILSLDSDPALAGVEGVSVTFRPGWTEEALRQREQVCLVPEEMAAEEYLTLSAEPGERLQLKVIGVVSGGGGNVIYCPFFMPWQEGTSVAIMTDSCSFDIRDNQNLEQSKAQIYQWFVEPALSNQYDGLTFGVLVHDALYQKSVQGIRDNLAMLRRLLPVLMLLCGAIGFFGGFLATRSRTREFAVMRCIGMSRLRVLGVVCFELTLLALLGASAGIGLGALVEGGIQAAAVRKAALITGIFILGAAIAAARIANVNVMKLMKAED